jgi:hypothetical protein
MQIFDAAIRDLKASPGGVTAVRDFQEYLSSNGLPKAKTAPSISVDAISRLAPELRMEKAMVFRLGQGTFALAQSTVMDWSDFFILDGTIWNNVEEEVFVPRIAEQILFAYQLLPSLTESSTVNLAIASGLMAHALDLENSEYPSAPATAQSTFTFSFCPKEGGDVWEHRSGQVQIDAAITGKRSGQTVLFLIEAKLGAPGLSLAKHKLVYPVLSIAPKVPPSMPIVPVYLRAERGPLGVSFFFTECAFPNYSNSPVLTSLQPVRRRRFLLAEYGKMV